MSAAILDLSGLLIDGDALPLGSEFTLFPLTPGVEKDLRGSTLVLVRRCDHTSTQAAAAVGRLKPLYSYVCPPCMA